MPSLRAGRTLFKREAKESATLPTLRITQTAAGPGRHHVTLAFRDDAGTELAAQADFDFALTAADQERLQLGIWRTSSSAPTTPPPPSPSRSSGAWPGHRRGPIQEGLPGEHTRPAICGRPCAGNSPDTRVEVATDVREAATIP